MWAQNNKTLGCVNLTGSKSFKTRSIILHGKAFDSRPVEAAMYALLGMLI